MIEVPGCPAPNYPVFSKPDLSEGIKYIDGVNFHRRCELIGKGVRRIFIYPPLGNVCVALEYFAQRFGITTLTQLEREVDPSRPLNPPNVNNATKSLGSQFSPEGICYPFKPLMGHVLQSANRFELLREAMDEDVIYPVYITHESSGLCRERTYGRLAEARLHDYYAQKFGHTKFDFYVLKDSIGGVMEFVSFLLDTTGENTGADKLTKTVNFINTINLINEAIERLDLTESFEKEVRYTQSLVQKQDFYKAERILQGVRLALASGDLPNDKIGGVLDEMRQQLNALPKERQAPKGKIAIAGEVFLVEEMGSSAADLGKFLGQNGYYYEKTVGQSHYSHKVRLDIQRVLRFLLKKANPLYKDHKLELAAEGGLKRGAGGHSLETVALAAAIKRGEVDYDAVIELSPFNCLPQILAANIVHCEKPWLRLLFDEQTGIAGVHTRVEAFLEMIERQKERARRLGLVYSIPNDNGRFNSDKRRRGSAIPGIVID